MKFVTIRHNLISMSELRIIDFASILFYSLLFYFPFILSYLVKNKMKKTKYDTIIGRMIWSQKSQNHMIKRRV